MATEHKTITGSNIHIPNFVAYADATARLAATPSAADVGKLALQTDTGVLYRLKTDSPLVWTPVALEPTGNLIGQVNGVAVATVTAGAALGATALQGATAISILALTIAQAIATSGSPTALGLTAAAHTTLAASTEASDVDLNLARTVQFATGALTTQRAVRVRAPTYGFVGASTITTAATMSIAAAPTAGTNATITNALALLIEAGALGFGSGGTSTAQTGTIRGPAGFSIVCKDTGATDRNVIDLGATTSDRVTVGNSNLITDIRGSTTGINIVVNGTVRLKIDGTPLTLSGGTLQWDAASGTAAISQLITSGATGAQMSLTAQGTSNTGGTAGSVTLTGGAATASSGTHTAGNVISKGGLATAGGTPTDGYVSIQKPSGTDQIKVNSTGIGFFNVPPAAQQADQGALTDNTTGSVDGTLADVGVAFSQSAVNNNFADCADRINKVRTCLRTLGLMA